MTPLVTFKGWSKSSKDWFGLKKIQPGRAALDAALTVLPGSGTTRSFVKGVAKNVSARVGSKLIRGASSKVGRWFRSVKGKAPAVRPGAHIGSKVTSGALKLGNKQAFRAGGTAFNIQNAAKVGAASVAAVGVGKAIGLGKSVQPSSAVSVAHGSSLAPRMSSAPNYGGTKEGISQGYIKPQTQPSPRRTPAKRVTSKGARCGCPAGKKHVCFKKSYVRKQKPAKVTSSAKPTKRKSSRAPSAKQLAARKRFAAASRKGPIRKGARL